MDWSRAKNILIVIFISLNFFLLFSIRQSYMESGVSRETIANAEKILDKKGIILLTDIPTYLSDTGLPIYDEGAGISIADISEKLPTNIKPENKEDVIKYTKKLLAEKGLPVSKFTVETAIVDNEGTLQLSFVEKYKRFFIFDNTVKVQITKSGDITAAQINYRKITGISVSKKAIIPAYQIILINYGVADTTITAIDIGFIKHKLDQSTTGVFEGPVWRIRLKSGMDDYYDGYSGQKIEK